MHPDLARAVLRHRRVPSRRPAAAHTVRAFCVADAAVRASGRAVVLDSGCGSGESSLALAEAHPGLLVIGVDKSAARLARAPAPIPGRLLFVRGELADLWRLAAARRWPVAAHCLFYPNPWPRRKHLLRRWHAHPAMASLLQLGGRLELRTNWRIYAEEFARALALSGVRAVQLSRWKPDAPISPFERKYLASDHALYRVVAALGGPGAAIVIGTTPAG